jgi:hypothetical protein
MYGPINVKTPNNIRKWQMGFNSAFKGLSRHIQIKYQLSLYMLIGLQEFDLLHDSGR